MLYRFHAIVIAAGIVFTFGFALYQLVMYGTGEGSQRGTAASFAAGGIALSLYLRWFLQKRAG